jgi:hypothetical protein
MLKQVIFDSDCPTNKSLRFHPFLSFLVLLMMLISHAVKME